jgi:hypothetical protein
MTYQRDSFKTGQTAHSITFCSCIPCRTELEQSPAKWEVVMMWAKDAAAGFGLVAFMAMSFLMAQGAHGLLKLL